jgi:hypothetical protein
LTQKRLERRPERRFYFRLALALGRTVADLLAGISSAELTEWEAYYQLEPFGELRGDLRAGIVASAIVNVMAELKTPLTPIAFMPYASANDLQSDGGGQTVILEQDPDVHSALIMTSIFGVTPESAYPDQRKASPDGSIERTDS